MGAGGAITGFFEDAFRNSTTYSLQQHLGRVLPISSNFFLVFVFFRAVYLPVQRLIMPHPGIICWAVRKYLCVFGCAVTPRDRTVKYSPRGVRMGREVGVFLMVVMLGLTFSLTAPVMAPACVLFFVGNFVVWRYHVLYVYERGYESNGSMWYTAAELVVWSLLVAQSFTSCVLFSKAAWLQGIALYVTVPYYLYRYMVSIKAEFGGGNSWSVPLGLAEKAPRRISRRRFTRTRACGRAPWDGTRTSGRCGGGTPGSPSSTRSEEDGGRGGETRSEGGKVGSVIRASLNVECTREDARSRLLLESSN